MISRLGGFSSKLGDLFTPLKKSFEALPQVVQWMLGLDVVGVMDEFFKSLESVQRKWNKTFGAPWAQPFTAPTVEQKASGGIVGSRGPQQTLLGEQGAEWVINAPALRALASLNRSPATALAAVAGGGSGGSPTVIRLEIGGRPLLDYMDEHLEYRRRV
jgi:hypothetical protein